MTRLQLLLTCAAEECMEVAQRITKAIRFGMDEVQEGQALTNAERIRAQLLDLAAVVEMLDDEWGGLLIDGVSWEDVDAHHEAKREKVERYLRLSAQQGVLAE